MCILIRSEEFEQRPLAEQDLIERSIRDVPGIRMIENEEWLNVISALGTMESPVVMILPLSLKTAQRELKKLLAEFEKRMPLPQFIAVLLLVQNNGDSAYLHAADFQQNAWLERIDQFFDNALPVQFLFTSSEHPRVVQMNLSAAVSSLWKSLESIRELRTLSGEIETLRLQMESLELSFRA
ncbi:MAG: hypothetical protein RJB13_969 [Pseudomonadota bacterium]|jgi:hypothetical protein